jgi:outer membrane protein TolC
MFRYKKGLLFALVMLGLGLVKSSLKFHKTSLYWWHQVLLLVIQTQQKEIPNIGTFFADSTLSALIDTALNNNFDLQVAMQRVEVARAGIRFSRGLGIPEVSAGVVAGGKKFGDYTIDGVGNYDTQFSTNLNDKQSIPQPFIPDYMLGLQSSWEVDVWGKLKSQKKAALARFLSSEFGKT